VVAIAMHEQNGREFARGGRGPAAPARKAGVSAAKGKGCSAPSGPSAAIIIILYLPCDLHPSHPVWTRRLAAHLTMPENDSFAGITGNREGIKAAATAPTNGDNDRTADRNARLFARDGVTAPYVIRVPAIWLASFCPIWALDQGVGRRRWAPPPIDRR